jgi:hypothetical protein
MTTEKSHPLDFVPDVAVSRMATLIYILSALSWDYVDSVLDIAAYQKRGGELKTNSRMIRKLKEDYDHTRCYFGIDGEIRKNENELALLFEQLCDVELKQIYVDTKQLLGENASTSNLELVGATQTALAVIDTLKLFADKCDALIAIFSRIESEHSILQDHFKVLRKLLVPYLLDTAQVTSQARVPAMRAMLTEIMNLPLTSDETDDMDFDVNPDHWRVCERCGQPKHISEYRKNARAKTGYERICKSCRK